MALNGPSHSCSAGRAAGVANQGLVQVREAVDEVAVARCGVHTVLLIHPAHHCVDWDSGVLIPLRLLSRSRGHWPNRLRTHFRACLCWCLLILKPLLACSSSQRRRERSRSRPTCLLRLALKNFTDRKCDTPCRHQQAVTHLSLSPGNGLSTPFTLEDSNASVCAM